MFDKFRPLNNNVWVELIEEEAKTAGGLFIPDGAKEKTQKGKVLAVGLGKRDSNGNVIPMQVHVGDEIFFGKFAGTAAGEKFLIVKEDEILGVIEK
ncbi:co-chaperone GroES [bacterium]|nr:co-chaperone GroES [bacterium]NBX78372.1 co-chaperone GroES [bacterium]